MCYPQVEDNIKTRMLYCDSISIKELMQTSTTCLSMAFTDGYDYSGVSHFIKEFQNLFIDRSFISKMEENYGTLWQFRNYVVGWSLGVSQYKGYTHLLHKESNSLAFLPLNVLEKVILIEQFHG